MQLELLPPILNQFSIAILLQKPNSMTDPNDLSLDNEREPEDTTTETVTNEIALQNQSASNVATENQHTSGSTSTRNWILYLPPEIRAMIYRYVLQQYPTLPYEPFSLNPHWQFSLTPILNTSRLIRREGLDIFYRENTFRIPQNFWTCYPAPSPQYNDIIQNFRCHTSLIQNSATYTQLSDTIEGPDEAFLAVIHRFTDPAIIRGTIEFSFSISNGHYRGAPLDFFIHCLGRFTNFRIVEVHFYYDRDDLSTAVYRDRVETALRFVLGPARTHDSRPDSYLGPGLIFYPQRFLHAQQSEENVNGIDRQDRDGDEANADRDADESEPPA